LDLRKSFLDALRITDPNIRRFFDVTYWVVHFANHYTLEDLKDESIKKTLRSMLNQHKTLFDLIHGSPTYYSHDWSEHMQGVMEMLAKFGLRLIDIAVYSLENFHCVEGRVNVFGGSRTYRSDGDGKYTIPYFPLDTEMKRWYGLMLLRIDIDAMGYSILKRDSELIQARKTRLESSQIPLPDDPIVDVKRILKRIEEQEDDDIMDEEAPLIQGSETEELADRIFKPKTLQNRKRKALQACLYPTVFGEKKKKPDPL